MDDQFAFLLPVIMLTFGCAFLIVWRAGVRAAGSWGTGYLLAGTAYAVPSLLGTLPDDAVPIVADTLFAIAFYVFGQALLVRFDCSRIHGLRSVLCVSAVAVSAYAVLVLHSLRAELVASDVSCSALLLGPMVLIRGRVRRPIDVAVFAISALTMADNLARTAGVLVTTGSDDLSSFTSTEYAFLMQASGAVLGLIFGLTALAAVTLDVVDRYRDEAVTDGLTQLLNRRGFERATWAAKGAPRPGSVVACDIDHFKRVNDSFGHAAGDQVIVGFARIIGGLLLPGAVAARVGGEEFAIFLPGHGAAESGLFADRVRTAMAARDWSGAGVDRALTASFGVAVIEGADASIHDALARADKELYTAKSEGRDRVSTAPLLRAA